VGSPFEGSRSITTVKFAAVVLGLVIVPMTLGRAQVGLPRDTVFMTATGHSTVTIARSGVVFSTLTFPKGTRLSAFADRHTDVTPGQRRMEFHGAFELRALPANEVPAAGPSADVMSRAPATLSAQGVDVVIESLP